MITTDLFQFAYIPAWYDQLDALAHMALPEPWRFRTTNPERKNQNTPILERYLHYIFKSAAIDHQNAPSPEAADAAILLRNEYACFNTGLLTRHYKPIYAYFERNKREGVIHECYFKGFVDESASYLQHINPLPQKPFSDLRLDVVAFWADWPIRVNTEHILQTPENYERIPEKYRSFKNLYLLLETAIEMTRRYAEIVPSIIVLQLYQGRMQFLMPVCLADPHEADLAMTVSVMDGYYLCSTCLTLEMAYSNARLLAKPTAPWLMALVE